MANLDSLAWSDDTVYYWKILSDIYQDCCLCIISLYIGFTPTVVYYACVIVPELCGKWYQISAHSSLSHLACRHASSSLMWASPRCPKMQETSSRGKYCIGTTSLHSILWMRYCPHLPVTPAQLMRPDIGQNASYVSRASLHWRGVQWSRQGCLVKLFHQFEKDNFNPTFQLHFGNLHQSKTRPAQWVTLHNF